MTDLAPEVEAEYQRFANQCSYEELGKFALPTVEILRAHFLVISHFYGLGRGIGGIGPRDIGLLQSAVHRQVASFQGQLKWQTLFDVCATLFFGLIRDHPFFDANKRTAFLCLLLQLYRAGWCPSVSERDLEDFTVEVAERSLKKHARFKSLLKSGDHDPEVKFISWYLRKNTRKIDKNFYSVTYNQLQTILNHHGFTLANPHGNHIDVYRIEKRRPIWGLFGQPEDNFVKVGQIGFPRWTAEVGKGAIKSVRQMTNLSPADGVDSASFFKGVDTLQSLITSYHAPLLSLANR